MAPLVTLLLPGLDGTGLMLRRFADALPQELAPRIVAYPRDRTLGYGELEGIVEAAMPMDEPCAIVAESFSGPLAIRIAAKQPEGLVAVVLVATFARKPVPWWMALARPLVTRHAFAIAPPAFILRALIAGRDADQELVAELRAAMGSVQPSVAASRVRAALDVDVVAILAESRVRLLYVEAGEDALLRSGIVAEMRRVRPDMEVATIRAPHLVLQRRPREAAAAIAAFLATDR